MIGRDPASCDLVIDGEKVSRMHAKVRRDWGGVTVFDLGSTNGVKVNGQRIDKEQKLRDRDELDVGGVRMVYLDPTELRETGVKVPLPPAERKAPEPAVLTSEPGTVMFDPDAGEREKPPEQA